VPEDETSQEADVARHRAPLNRDRDTAISLNRDTAIYSSTALHVLQYEKINPAKLQLRSVPLYSFFQWITRLNSLPRRWG